MRCPQCNYIGEQVEGSCPRCGFGSVQVAQGHISFSHRGLSNAQPAPAYQLSRGDVLRRERYRLVKELPLPENQKNQGIAWLAIDSSSNSRVVIREILSPPGFQSTDPQEIHLAATRLAELSKKHQGIPAVLDLFAERGKYCIVLEDREGNNLATLIQQQERALPERIFAEYGRQLCELLSVLSSCNPPFVHGGISPSTILVSPDGANVSLIHLPIFPPDTFPVGNLNGHPGYFAPEQAHGVVDPSLDLYSLAATLYHAVTGSDPVDRAAFFYLPARRLNPTVTKTMEAILARELHLSPAHRYPHPAAMQQDLRALIASYPDPEMEPASPSDHEYLLTLSAEQMRQRSRSNSLLDIGVVASIVVLLLVVLLFFAFR